MPVAPPASYPGVYIQGVESPVHTITPVPTSTTAFVSLALRGEPDKAMLIYSFGDSERIFGSLWNYSSLGGRGHRHRHGNPQPQQRKGGSHA